MRACTQRRTPSVMHLAVYFITVVTSTTGTFTKSRHVRTLARTHVHTSTTGTHTSVYYPCIFISSVSIHTVASRALAVACHPFAICCCLISYSILFLGDSERHLLNEIWWWAACRAMWLLLHLTSFCFIWLISAQEQVKRGTSFFFFLPLIIWPWYWYHIKL